MAKGRPKKDKFDLLSDEFKTAVSQSDTVEIKRRIVETSISDCELRKAKKEDQDLAEKAEIYKEAGVVYKEGAKINRLKIDYCKLTLDQRAGK